MTANVRPARAGAALACAVAAAALLVALAASGFAGADPAQRLDLERTNQLTVTESTAVAELGSGEVTVDAYLIAKAVQVEGYDTYTYAPVESGPLAELDVAGLNEAAKVEDPAAGASSESAEAFSAFAQSALDTIGKAATEGDTSVQPVAAKTLSRTEGASSDAAVLSATFADSNALPCGLYLIVAHGTSLGTADYFKTVDGKMTTIAQSAYTEYAFSPVMVSLPTRQGADGEALTTASGDGWYYSATAGLKTAASPRMGSLKIVKGLDRYDDSKPATFVFSVKAYDRSGAEVYDNVVSIDFAAPGTQEVVVDNIPAGSRVEVTEVYSGASYQVQGASETEATISATDVASVQFANTVSNTNTKGGSVTNNFKYDGGEWQWSNNRGQGTAEPKE